MTASSATEEGAVTATPEPSPWAIPLADLHVDDEIIGAAHEALTSGWWTMGPRVQEFEQSFGALCGSEHALAVANGTAALHLALLACGCGPGDEVIVPSLNFVAAANVIAAVGATPVFCDIGGPDNLNLDPEDVEAAVTPATKAILVLHYAGFPCDLDAVVELAERHGLTLIEDAAHAPGSSWRGRMCGSFGRVGCFSFFSNKNLPVGEGGMVVTDDAEVAERIRLLRSHGMTTLTWDRRRGHAASYDVVAQGFNYRLDEVRAAIGLVQLGRLEAANAARRRAAAEYRRRLDGAAGITVPFSELEQLEDVVSAQHLAVVILPDGSDRDQVRHLLQEQRIQTSVHYPPIHRFTQYTGTAGARALPRTDAVSDRILTLPLYSHIDLTDVGTVADALLAACARSRRAP